MKKSIFDDQIDELQKQAIQEVNYDSEHNAKIKRA